MATVEAIDSAIERYLNGEMSERERAEFHERVANDPESARLLQAERLVRFATDQESERAGALVAPRPDRTLMAVLERTAVVGATLARRRLWGLYIGVGAALLSTVLFLTLRGTPTIGTPNAPAEQSAPTLNAPTNLAPAPAIKSTEAHSTEAASAEAPSAKTTLPKHVVKSAAHTEPEAAEPAPNLNMNPPRVFTK